MYAAFLNFDEMTSLLYIRIYYHGFPTNETFCLWQEAIDDTTAGMGGYVTCNTKILHVSQHEPLPPKTRMSFAIKEPGEQRIKFA